MKFHIFAALFSVAVAGLGQIIKGEGKKGVAILLTIYFVLPAAVYLSLLLKSSLFLFVLGFAIIFGIIIWTYNILDALLTT
ncbi:hypothetical protein ACFL4J_00145 [Candidatus Margulisiibacteriota bacterium]